MTGLILTVAGCMLGAGAFTCSHRAPVALRYLDLYRPAERAAARWAMPKFLDRHLNAAGISSTQAQQGRALVGLGATASVILLVLGERGAAVLFVVLTVGAPMAVMFAWRHRRDDELLASLPDALELASRSLRSGSSVPQALAEAAATQTGPIGSAFDRIVAGTKRGESLENALARFASLSQRSELRVAAAALAMAAESGAGPARALDGVSDSLRDGRRVRKEIMALTSQARSSAGVLIALPVAFVALNALIDPAALVFLFRDQFGRVCLTLGLTLDVLGWLWMRRLIAAVRS